LGNVDILGIGFYRLSKVRCGCVVSPMKQCIHCLQTKSRKEFQVKRSTTANAKQFYYLEDYCVSCESRSAEIEIYSFKELSFVTGLSENHLRQMSSNKYGNFPRPMRIIKSHTGKKSVRIWSKSSVLKWTEEYRKRKVEKDIQHVEISVPRYNRQVPTVIIDNPTILPLPIGRNL
jgi:predicted DNA-binding transcriptional regulator AlpA